MAWENIEITGMSTGLFTGNMEYPSWSSDYSNFVISLTPAQVAAMSTPSSPYEYAILGDLTTGLIMQRNGSSSSTFIRFLLRYNGVNCLRGWGTNGTYFMSDSDGHYVTFFFAIDDVSERGTYSCVFTENNQQSFNEYTWNYCANSHDAYLAIKSLVPPIPTYSWHSLTSISGNGLTVPLVKLTSDAINDGDPVSDATTSAFDVLPSSDNNVRSLVNLTLEPISTDNAVTITYSIPALKDDSYSSVKVYAKIGEAPKCDETDDIVEDIDPTINEISLENLEFETEYFFCIQSISNNGLKLSSNVESITTEKSPVPQYLYEVGTYLIGREGNKQSILECPIWQNGSYMGRYGWSIPMSLYHPSTNINSDSISLASFTDGATINIDTSTGIINVTYTGFTASRMFYQYGYPRARIAMYWQTNGAPEGSYWVGYESGNDSNYCPTKNDFRTLDELYEYIYEHFRHVNIILDGRLVVEES